MKRFLISVLGVLFISGCGNSTPSSGEIKNALEKVYSICKNVEIKSAKKINGFDRQDGFYEVEYEFVIKNLAFDEMKEWQKERDLAKKEQKEIGAIYQADNERINQLLKLTADWIATNQAQPLDSESYFASLSPEAMEKLNYDAGGYYPERATYQNNIMKAYNRYVEEFKNNEWSRANKNAPYNDEINELTKKVYPPANHVMPSKSVVAFIYEGCFGRLKNSDKFPLMNDDSYVEEEWSLRGSRVMRKTEQGWL